MASVCVFVILQHVAVLVREKWIRKGQCQRFKMLMEF